MPMLKYVSLFALIGLCKSDRPLHPNIVFFLTDDQDQHFGSSFPQINGVGPMSWTQKNFAEKGNVATNFYIHTPICCPSRAETLTGRYFHNLRKTRGEPRCMHADMELTNNITFAKKLEKVYTVGLFGKYLNIMPSTTPDGFDAFFGNDGGAYYNPSFYASGLTDIGIPDGIWKGTKDNYTTSVVGNVSLAWLENVAVKGSKPFFLYSSPKACHEPFQPAPWYEGFWNPSWPEDHHHGGAWNASHEVRADHHGVIATNDMLTVHAANFSKNAFQQRWRTLLSVDDLIRDTVNLVEKLGKKDNTYFFFSSDHGFQLGEFNILIDKRQTYEWDIHIHLLSMGPGIEPGSKMTQLGSNVDLLATWYDLAGFDARKDDDVRDGKSLLPFLISDKSVVAESTLSSLSSKASDYTAKWRDSIFIEYFFVDPNPKCQQPNDMPNEGDNSGINCYPTESPANNYITIRHVGGEFGNTLYAEFQTGTHDREINFTKPDFIEYYNLDKDPDQLTNLMPNPKKLSAETQALRAKLHHWFNCAGSSCP